MRKEQKKILLAMISVMIFVGLGIVAVKAEAASKKYAKKLSVTKTYVEMEEGEQKSVGYNVAIAQGGSKKIIVKNSNKKIVSAKVSGKKIVIKAKNEGKSTITAVTKAKNKRGKKIAKKIQVIVKNKDYDYDYVDDDMADVPQEKPVSVPSISYQVHVQGTGWMESVKDGEIAGSTGNAKRCEGIKINLADSKGNSMIQYRAYVQSIGWQEWKTSGQLAGTEYSSMRMEGIQIQLVGDYADKYDIYYSPHLRKYGWLGWAKNGEFAGSQGLSLQMEAIKIKLVKKNEAFDIEGRHTIVKPDLSYNAYVATVGWCNQVSEGAVAGTAGEAKRLEALVINLLDSNGASGIEYRAYCASIGWQAWKKSGEIAGTTNESRRMEAIEIKLTGSIAEDFDIYYRMHVAKIGWLGWAANGETAGTSGGARQAEAIEIKLVYKGADVERDGKAYYELTMEQEQPGGTNHTADEAIAWAASKVGQSLEGDNDFGLNNSRAYQCVDFIICYYKYLGVAPSTGNGCDYATNALPPGWTRVKGGHPQKGDILVYSGNYGNEAGHVAIYESDRSTYHQNLSNCRKVTHETYMYNGLSNPYWGYIRPNW